MRALATITVAIAVAAACQSGKSPPARDATYAKDLERICNAHKGKHALKVRLVDYTNKQSLNFASGARKVNADSDFAMEMEKLGLECTVG